MDYNNGDYIKLNNGLIGIFYISHVKDLYLIKHKYGQSVVSLDMIECKVNPHDYLIEMKKCKSCESYSDIAYFYKFENEEMCKTCYDICVDEHINDQDNVKTQKNLYNWGKI